MVIGHFPIAVLADSLVKKSEVDQMHDRQGPSRMVQMKPERQEDSPHELSRAALLLGRLFASRCLERGDSLASKAITPSRLS